jgi:hypothetical protein
MSINVLSHKVRAALMWWPLTDTIPVLAISVER